MQKTSDSIDTLVVGAGVVGLAIGAELAKQGREVVVVERLPQFGMETSSRNSEVIHAGLYYATASLKAQLCVRGNQLLYPYCQRNQVGYRRLGKLVVAQQTTQLPQLAALQQQAQRNGVMDTQLLTAEQVHAKEPAINACGGLWSPSTGIIDSHGFMTSLLGQLQRYQGHLVSQTEFITARPLNDGFDVELETDGERYQLHCRELINCAGLWAQSVSQRITGLASTHIPQAYWCRGHYFSYQAPSPFKHLVYPLPPSDGSGLGIHSTLDLGGQLKFGPDTQYIDVNPDLPVDYAMPAALQEKFTQAISDYFPQLDGSKLVPAYSGVRPKLHNGAGNGSDDFIIQGAQTHGLNGLVNLFGIESPGLTASLAIAEYVARLLDK
ncbi:NAD(P)/FAD-dependent oxidoreductase [Shewanella sp. Scap07]|uniref:NAD(P)/FAD-dependent oxidoreductase n=1 Tax=Shewanella sp. Scap07 TaxID=2589987 RepID=UPI0015BD3B96|nr:NAD(P)/FAD-dependent oxidoreductase [Shewanella sp. Scap07]QLE84137.1 NAD(P)/FAD-dependent oxidoreductase [Shewanella sp. Scap07]